MQKSLFTALLPVLFVTGAVILVVMWNKEPTQTVKIEGPSSAPTSVMQ